MRCKQKRLYGEHCVAKLITTNSEIIKNQQIFLLPCFRRLQVIFLYLSLFRCRGSHFILACLLLYGKGIIELLALQEFLSSKNLKLAAMAT